MPRRRPLIAFCCRWIAALVLLGPALPAVAQVDSEPASAALDDAQADRNGFDLSRPHIAAFIRQCVVKDGLSRAQLLSVLAQARGRPELVAAMDRPVETTLPWWQYRQRFVTPERILLGRQFWYAHKELLDEVALERGVQPEYLVAILGIESKYGFSTGRYREIDTLMTLAFDYPSRSRFFREQLRQFLLLAHEQGLDVLTTQGSYGGALGALQFMPSSYRTYAVAEARGHVNLWDDWDAILQSEANFLRAHGWRPGEPVLLGATVAPGAHVSASGGVSMDETLAELKAGGLLLDSALPDSTPAVLIEAPEENAMSYRVGLNNFYVLTRYNPRINYVLAVDELARQLRSNVLASPSQSMPLQLQSSQLTQPSQSSAP